MRLAELMPLSKTEKAMVARIENEDDAVMAVLNRRKYLEENTAYISCLCKDQYRARFACHNEKETITMPILTQEDY